MVTGWTSVGIPVHLGIRELGDDHLGCVHHDLVSSPHSIMQGLSARVAQVGEVAGPAAAVELEQIERSFDRLDRLPTRRRRAPRPRPSIPSGSRAGRTRRGAPPAPPPTMSNGHSRCNRPARRSIVFHSPGVTQVDRAPAQHMTKNNRPSPPRRAVRLPPSRSSIRPTPTAARGASGSQ